MVDVIPKVSKGSDIGGLMYYLLDVDEKRTRNVHVDPHIVAGSPEIEAWWAGRTLDASHGRPIGHELDSARQAHGTRFSDGKHVWHCSLSLRADEGKLSDEKWAEIAREMVTGMGFDDPSSGKAPCQWAAVRHGLSEGGNDHIHLAVSLVRADGTKADVFRDYLRAQKLAREIEQRHGLRRLAERGRSSRGLSRAELQRQERQRASEPERIALARTVRAVAAQSATEAEFVTGLRGVGANPRPWYAKSSGGTIVGGYSVQAAGSPVRLGGKSLANDLSLPRLRQARGWTPGEESVAAWRSRRSWRPARDVTPDAAAWQAGEAEIARLREWMGTIPLDDARTWTVAAHELAGVLAAGSLACEGGEPGPLAEAADALARSSQVHGRGTVDRPVDMPNTRGVARLVASAARGGQGSVAEIALWQQLRNTARALHDAHVAQQDAQRAQEIAAVMRGRLAELTRPATQPQPQPQQQPQQVPGRTAVLDRPRTPSGEQRGRSR